MKIKILKILFLASLFLNFLLPNIVIADDMPIINLGKDTVPTLSSIIKFEPIQCDGQSCSVPWIKNLIVGIYNYAIGIVGILAVIAMMIGGVFWLTAGGNPGGTTKAKGWIKGGLIGMSLAFCSYLILYQVNPDLLDLKDIKVKKLQKDISKLALDNADNPLSKENLERFKDCASESSGSCTGNKTFVSNKEICGKSGASSSDTCCCNVTAKKECYYDSQCYSGWNASSDLSNCGDYTNGFQTTCCCKAPESKKTCYFDNTCYTGWSQSGDSDCGSRHSGAGSKCCCQSNSNPNLTKINCGGSLKCTANHKEVSGDTAAALDKLKQLAAARGETVKITSAYRTPEEQKDLWEKALAKYGSPEAARKFVAPPGNSAHDQGIAVDACLGENCSATGYNQELDNLMKNAGFIRYCAEGWHYELKSASKKTGTSTEC